MEEEGGGIRLSKRFSDKGGEVDYKTKAGTAWSHSFLNQKPWHPLSYPNQRRKWIAEQTLAQRELRAEEISREYAREQEFFRQTALVSKKEKEKMEMMKAVSFMYVRPPGYNPESAKAAEIADEAKNQGQGHGSTSQDTSAAGASTSGLETGVVGRAKPFGIEIRNVKCVRCGTFGHQSGDRECPLKDAIMPNEESRIKRDDPLTAILAQTDASEPLKWELKQRPGISPPRGGFELDDPNQQIVAEDIFDEYGGFLTGDIVPDLLASLSSKPKKKKKSSKRKNRKRSSPARTDLHDDKEISSSSDDDRGRPLKKKKNKKSGKQSRSREDSDGHRRQSNKRRHPRSSWGKHSESISGDDDNDRHQKRSNRHGPSRSSSPEPENGENRKKNHHCKYHDSEDDYDHRKENHHHYYHDPKDDDNDRHQKRSNRHRLSWSSSSEPEDKDHRKKNHPSYCHDSKDADNDRHQKRSNRHRHSRPSSPEPEDMEQQKKIRHHHYHDSKDDDNDRHQKRSNRHGRSRPSSPKPEDKKHGKRNHHHHYHDSEDYDNDRHQKRSSRHRRSESSSPEPEDKEHRKNHHHHRHHCSGQQHIHSDYS
ncbi:unnamed protein product [Withania somnifera]